MKVIKKANGERTIKMSKKEWEAIGKIANWDDEGDGELSPDALKMIEDLEVKDIKEEKGAIPANLKRKQKRIKKDKADWDADQTTKLDKKIKQKENKAKNRKEEYYEKIRKMPPIA